MNRPKLSEDGIRALLSLKMEDFTLQWLKDNCGVFDAKSKALIPVDAEFVLTESDIQNISLPKLGASKITTTAGRFLANFFVLGNSELTKHFTYVNEPWGKKIVNGFILGKVGRLLLEEKISPQAMKDFIDRINWLGMAPTSFLSYGVDTNMFRTSPQLLKKREETFEENKEAIEKVDVAKCVKIQKDLENFYYETISDDDAAMAYINSGAAKSVMNVVSVTRGLVPESRNRNKMTFIKSSLQDGIEKNEITNYADIAVVGGKSRGLETQKGGYVTKKFNACFGHIEADEPGSDCKTKYGIEIVIDKKTIDDYHLRYVVHKGNLVLLDEENINKLMGEKVLLRSPMYCTSERICSKCLGELMYRMGIKNVGYVASRIGNSILNSSLKSFHDSTIKVEKIDIDKCCNKV